MAHQALFRKYRSQSFENLTGQDHITRTLQNALRLQRVGQAYLFCGPRGTGKTSTARIFAKAINCIGPDPAAPLTQPPSEPCNECAICRRITSGTSLDVIEMDAASNTGVDNVRDAVVGKVDFAPVEGRRKVYIIDEVHKLSSSAFAALLKTLEEPPPHLVFMLATTDPNDLPATILSRCQRFDFRRIPDSLIKARLALVSEGEGLSIDAEAIEMITEAADGGLRDALVILEQAVSYADERITGNVVGELLGVTNKQDLFDLSRAILGAKTREALEILDRLMLSGRDLLTLARDMLSHIRALLITRVVGKGAAELLHVSEEMAAQLAAQAAEIDERALTRTAGELMKLEKLVREAVHVRLSWEMAIIAMSTAPAPQAEAVPAPRAQGTPAHEPPRTAAAPRPEAPRHTEPPRPEAARHTEAPRYEAPRQAEAPRYEAPRQPEPTRHEAPRHAEPHHPPQAPAHAATGGVVTLEVFQTAWTQLLDQFRREKRSPLLTVFLSDCRPITVEGENCIIGHHDPNAFQQDKMAAQKAGLSQRLSELIGRPVQLKLRRTAPPPPPETRALENASPEQIHFDLVNGAQQVFGGTTQ